MSIPLVMNLQGAVLGQDDNVSVLSEVNFSLAEAEMCYLVGRSGSGKSTFLKTLYGTLPLQGGEAEIAGFNLKTLKRKEVPLLRRHLGMVFQEFHLFERWTVAQNLDYVLKATDWKDEGERLLRVDDVLNQIKLSHKKDTPIHQLSGGEQQKVVIGRAILNKPAIIIADEPTGNLDPQSSEEVMDMLYDVAIRNKTAILIATHDTVLMEKYPARVFKCEKGGVLEV